MLYLNKWMGMFSSDASEDSTATMVLSSRSNVRIESLEHPTPPDFILDDSFLDAD